MTRRVGLTPPKLVKAKDQLSKSYGPPISYQPLPPGTPRSVAGEAVGIKDPGKTLSFVMFGDHGGIENPEPQKAVAAALVTEVENGCSFVYSVGDWVYFASDPDQWMPQFYQVYAHVQAPFVGIMGNHEASNDGVPNSGVPQWMSNICTPTPARPAADPDDEFGRSTMTQPYCDWTLALDAITIVGVWSNAPSGGRIENSQQAFLVEQVKAAPTDRPLAVCLHHPPFSCDAFHGGSATMASVLDSVFEAAGRYPEAVMSGHIHNQQAFLRTVNEKQILYNVTGNGGYHNTHAMAGDATPGMQVADDLVLEQFDAGRWGYLRWDLAPGSLKVSYVAVNGDGSVEAPVAILS